MSPQELREELIQALCDRLDDIGMEKVADAISGTFFEEDPEWLDKAKLEVYNSLSQPLRKISRLATRLDYLEKGDI